MVTVELSLYDVPTTECTTHKEAEICKKSDHVANEYCAEAEGNTVYKAGLLNVARGFPIPGVVVQDQSYVLPDLAVPSGYYPALSPDADAINIPCYVHTEADVPKDDEDEDAEDADGEKPDAQTAEHPEGGEAPQTDAQTGKPDSWNGATGVEES